MKTFKNLLTATVLLLAAPFVSPAQDVLFFTDWDTLNVQVISVSSGTITYKKSNNMLGPTYETATKKVAMIRYQNGSTEYFNAKARKTRKDAVKESPPDSLKFRTVKRKPSFIGAKIGSSLPIGNLNTLVDGHIGTKIAIEGCWMISGNFGIGMEAGLRFYNANEDAIYEVQLLTFMPGMYIHVPFTPRSGLVSQINIGTLTSYLEEMQTYISWDGILTTEFIKSSKTSFCLSAAIGCRWILGKHFRIAPILDIMYSTDISCAFINVTPNLSLSYVF